MSIQTPFTAAALALVSCTLTSCGSDPLPPPVSGNSVGQQLTDLGNARQQGLISNGEYNRLKKALIKRYD